jgi:hypothetical protein
MSQKEGRDEGGCGNNKFQNANDAGFGRADGGDLTANPFGNTISFQQTTAMFQAAEEFCGTGKMKLWNA